MDIVLANPRGFCAGVDRAIEIVKRAIETLGAPIYVRHEVVHNRYVVDRLQHGHVIDFIQWHWRDHYWPAFNIADAAIVGGAIGIALFGLLQGRADKG